MVTDRPMNFMKGLSTARCGCSAPAFLHPKLDVWLSLRRHWLLRENADPRESRAGPLSANIPLSSFRPTGQRVNAAAISEAESGWRRIRPTG
ncbi:hypothetical protein KCP74_11830 [Salmonella enterica subsp. enterica]|nr:hypothetical protein KCP74_11830 [Salmonella enterica subsp. enterica]